MNEQQKVIKVITEQENAYNPYTIKIDGYVAFNFIRRTCRLKYMKMAGVGTMDLVTKVDYFKAMWSFIQSCADIVCLLIKGSKVSNVFVAFPRVDLIGNLYVDKFSDPFIAMSAIDDDYIIFENGMGGVHFQNRMHKEKIINTDAINILSKIIASFGHIIVQHKYKKEINAVCDHINKIYGDAFIAKPSICKEITQHLYYCKMLQVIWKRLGAKRVFAPARPENVFIAAKCIGMKRYEMQHGITYGETDLYSGYKEESLVPDAFLAFGDINPKDVYGIDTRKILNVGWPLPDLIKNINLKIEVQDQDVLVISEPEVSEKILSATIKLAEEYPHSNFYMRPHPLEVLTEDQRTLIEQHPNVHLQDCRLNITVVLNVFSNIIGENSSVLYEALAINKKVGKVSMCNLNPLYLEVNDRDCFWHIDSVQDLKLMLEGQSSMGNRKSIYSTFNKILFDSLLED